MLPDTYIYGLISGFLSGLCFVPLLRFLGSEWRESKEDRMAGWESKERRQMMIGQDR